MLSIQTYNSIILRLSSTREPLSFTKKLELLEGSIKLKDFERAWACVQVLSPNDNYIGRSYNLIEKMGVNFEKLGEEEKKSYMYGMYFCLGNRQKTPFLISEINKNIKGLETLYINSFKEGDDRLPKFFQSIREEKSLEKNIKHVRVMIKDDKRNLNAYLSSLTNHTYDSSVFLKFLINTLDYTEIREIILNNNFDINAIGLISKYSNPEFNKDYFRKFKSSLFTTNGAHDFKTSFVHLTPFVNWSSEELKNFLIEFKDKIDLNSHFTYTYYTNHYVYKTYNFVNLLLKSKYSDYDNLNFISLILENYKISDDMIKSINEYIFSDKIIFKYSSHAVYDNFSKCINNLELFNNNLIIENILKVGKENYEKNASIPTNPIFSMLKKFIDNKNQENFDVWMKYAQSSKISKDNNINSLFISTYRDYISQWIKNNPDKLYKTMREVFITHNIEVPEKRNIWEKWLWFKNKSTVVAVSVEEKPIIRQRVEEQAILTNLVDEKVLVQVADQDIHKYISAIQLNYEHFHLLLNEQSKLENNYYMNTSLPKLLNNVIDSYIHFVSLDEREAKNNAITHLKLLHRKTIDVLNNALKEETEHLARNDRVLGRVLKKY